MDVIQLIGVLFEVLHRVHVRIVQMAGIQTQTGNLIRDIAHDLFDLVCKLDVAACVRMDDRTNAPFVGALAYGADVAHEARPFLIGEARCGIRMTGGVVALVVSPVHNGHVRRRELLTIVCPQHRQLGIGDQAADVVYRVQHALLIVRVEQVVEDRTCDNGKAVLFQLVCDQLRVDRQITVGAKLDGAVSGFPCFLQYARPRR